MVWCPRCLLWLVLKPGFAVLSGLLACSTSGAPGDAPCGHPLGCFPHFPVAWGTGRWQRVPAARTAPAAIALQIKERAFVCFPKELANTGSGFNTGTKKKKLKKK